MLYLDWDGRSKSQVCCRNLRSRISCLL
jgi:hypothetical protein